MCEPGILTSGAGVHPLNALVPVPPLEDMVDRKSKEYEMAKKRALDDHMLEMAWMDVLVRLGIHPVQLRRAEAGTFPGRSE